MHRRAVTVAVLAQQFYGTRRGWTDFHQSMAAAAVQAGSSAVHRFFPLSGWAGGWVDPLARVLIAWHLASLVWRRTAVWHFYASQYRTRLVDLCEVVEKKPRRPGRPRAYDTGAVLDRAAEVFWANGFSATSLDDLSAAMGMGRPSIYNAFGDKEALFLRALERFRDTVAATPLRAFESADSIQDALDALFRETVEYTTADSSHLGCLLVNVAPATDSPEVRRLVRANLAAIEELIAQRLTSAADSGELPSGYSSREGARNAVNLMVSLAARARMGTPRKELLRDAANATAIVMGAEPKD